MIVASVIKKERLIEQIRDINEYKKLAIDRYKKEEIKINKLKEWQHSREQW